jgi:hypothetical protein
MTSLIPCQVFVIYIIYEIWICRGGGEGRYKHKLKGERSALRLLGYLAARPASLYKKGIRNLPILKLRGYKKQPFISSTVRHSRKGICKTLCRVKNLVEKTRNTVFVQLHIAQVYYNVIQRSLQVYQS